MGERGTPRLSAEQVFRILQRHGFLLAGQSGSHQKWQSIHGPTSDRAFSSRKGAAIGHDEIDHRRKRRSSSAMVWLEEGRHFSVLDPIRNHFDSQPFCIADRFFPRRTVSHYARQLKPFGDPTPVFLAIELNGELHETSYVISPANTPAEPSQSHPAASSLSPEYDATPRSPILAARSLASTGCESLHPAAKCPPPATSV